MTTVIAVQCGDGVVWLIPNKLLTGGYWERRRISKIRPVSDHDKYCMLGCAGVPNYIDLYRGYVEKAFLNRENRSYSEALERATRSYASYITRRSRDIGDPALRSRHFPSALFAGYEPTDDRIRVYSLEPPDPPNELSAPYRIAIGTGGLYASLLFSIAEFLMSRIGFGWTMLSTKLVSQFCYMALGRIMSYDRDSGRSSSFYRIDRAGYWPLNNEQMFPGFMEKERNTGYQFFLRPR